MLVLLSVSRIIYENTDNITVAKFQFSFPSQLLCFPDGFQHSESLACILIIAVACILELKSGILDIII